MPDDSETVAELVDKWTRELSINNCISKDSKERSKKQVFRSPVDLPTAEDEEQSTAVEGCQGEDNRVVQKHLFATENIEEQKKLLEISSTTRVFSPRSRLIYTSNEYSRSDRYVFKWLSKTDSDLFFSLIHKQHRCVAYEFHRVDPARLLEANAKSRVHIRIICDSEQGLTLNPTDYKSGSEKFDLGHMCGRSAFGQRAAITDTMYNIAPMRQEFNRGTWRRVENQVKAMILEECKVDASPEFYVVTFALWDSEAQPTRIGGDVCVPTHYGKVLFVVQDGKLSQVPRYCIKRHLEEQSASENGKLDWKTNDASGFARLHFRFERQNGFPLMPSWMMPADKSDVERCDENLGPLQVSPRTIVAN